MRARTVGSDGVRRQHDARKWVAAVVAAGLMVSGCAGGGDDGDSAPSEIGTTSTAPATEAPEETPSQEPTELYGQPVTAPGVDPEGARQAAVEFMEVVEEAWWTGDTSEIQSRSENTCAYCLTQIAEIEENNRLGIYASEEMTLTIGHSEGFAPMLDNEFHSVLVELFGSEADLYNSAGEAVERSIESGFTLLVVVRKTHSGWSIVQALGVSADEAATIRSERS